MRTELFGPLTYTALLVLRLLLPFGLTLLLGTLVQRRLAAPAR